MTVQDEQIAEYLCPGQRYPISRAVHLGRLVRAYPACRRCAHRDDTGGLSARQIRRLVETRPRGAIRPLFHAEGAGGDLNEFSPRVARDLAAALGTMLRSCSRKKTGNNVNRPTKCGTAALDCANHLAPPRATVPHDPPNHPHQYPHVPTQQTSGNHSSLLEHHAHAPSVIIASDGRPPNGRWVAAVGEGLRWAGCAAVDIGATTAPCLAFTIEHLRADGGILVGTPADAAHLIGLGFWASGLGGPLEKSDSCNSGATAGQVSSGTLLHREVSTLLQPDTRVPCPRLRGHVERDLRHGHASVAMAPDQKSKVHQAARPLSAGGSLDALESLYHAGIDRPTRHHGPLRRFQAAEPYLSTLAEHYHALRPLRFVLDTPCEPLIGYLKRLTASVACQIIDVRAGRIHDVSDGAQKTSPLPPGEEPGVRAVQPPTQGPSGRLLSLLGSASTRLSNRVLAERAHFGATIDGLGETCRLVDERGRAVPAERLLMLLIRHTLVEHPSATIVLEKETDDATRHAVETAGSRVRLSSPCREAMVAAMRDHGALLGGGPSGRLWHNVAGLPLPDALRTLTLLLVLLSRSDRPLSEVLDRSATAR